MPVTSVDISSLAVSLLPPILLTLLLVAKTLSLIFTEPRSVEWKEFPEYDALSLRMAVRMSPQRRWGVTRLTGIARANALRGQVLFDSKSFFRLTPEERIAVTAHELAHISSRHSLFGSLILICGTVGAIVSSFEGSLVLPTIVWLLSYSAMVLYKRHGEYQADLTAVRFVPASSLVSALSRFRTGTSLYDRIADSLTHPSTKDRIERLRRTALSS